MRISFFIIFICLTLAACKSSKNKSTETSTYLIPEFSGAYVKVQSGNIDPNFTENTLYVMRIYNQEFKNESWVYLEEHNPAGLPIAHTNKYIEIIKSDIGYNLREYMPVSVSKKPNLADPNTFNSLKKNQLRRKGGCTIFLSKKDNGVITGSTLGESCANRFRGSLYSRTEMKITQDTLWLLEQGFDEYGRHIWGPKRYAPKYVKLSIED